MFGVITKTALALGLAGATLVAVSATSLAGPDAATYATTGADTSVPYGWVDFCQRYRGECQDDMRPARDRPATCGACTRCTASVQGKNWPACV